MDVEGVVNAFECSVDVVYTLIFSIGEVCDVGELYQVVGCEGWPFVFTTLMCREGFHADERL